MNNKYFIGKSEKQIENINNELLELRLMRDNIITDIDNKVCIRDLLKEGLKRYRREE